MQAAQLLDRLHSVGLSLTTDGERLLVTPRQLLTDELRAEIQHHRAELIAAVGACAELFAAINAACDERGDDDANRRALLAECSRLLPEQQADLIAHFAGQAAVYRAANRAGRDA